MASHTAWVVLGSWRVQEESLDDRRSKCAEDVASMRARLATMDASLLARKAQQVYNEKAQASMAGLKRAAESKRAREALREREQQRPRPNEHDAVSSNPGAMARGSQDGPHCREPRPVVDAASAFPPDGDLSTLQTKSHQKSAREKQLLFQLDGWHRVEAKCGRCYFVNSITQQAQWETPHQSTTEATRSEPSLAAVRWRHAIEALILAKRRHRVSATRNGGLAP